MLKNIITFVSVLALTASFAFASEMTADLNDNHGSDTTLLVETICFQMTGVTPPIRMKAMSGIKPAPFLMEKVMSMAFKL